MKKLLILLLGLCLALAGCGGPMGGAPDSQRPDGFFSRLEQIEYADGTDTAIEFSVSGHMEKDFTFQCSVWEGSFDAKFSGAVSGAVNGKVSSAGIILHEVFDDIRKARMEAFGTDFTVIVLS